MENLFSMKNINKRFGKVQVLKNVQFTVNKGEIHALMGENGAGKSTLMNILSGALKKDSGTIEFEGKEIKEATPEIAERLGIGFVHQELNLAESISVAENVFMNRLPCKNKILGIIDFKALYQQTQNILNILGAKFKPTDIVEHLSTANKQLVEIAKAISLNAKVIIFDEPTTSLSEQDVEVLFIVIRALKEKGISSVYISHRMKEIYELCDRITIMRDGKYISTNPVEELTNDEIIHKLVGRSLNNLYPKEEVSIGDIYLKVEGLSDKKGYLKNINFYARKGEVVGFAGLVGSGRTETMRMIFGADRSASGKISIQGREVKINSPIDAIKNGILYNDYAAVISVRLLENEIRNKQIYIFRNQESDWNRKFYLVYHKDRFFSEPMQLLESIVHVYKTPEFVDSENAGYLTGCEFDITEDNFDTYS